jgi:hypothetical protein
MMGCCPVPIGSLLSLAWFRGRASRNQELGMGVQKQVSRKRFMREAGGMCKGRTKQAGVFAWRVADK